MFSIHNTVDAGARRIRSRHFVAVSAILLTLASAANADMREQQDQAALLARAGDYTQALGILADLRLEYPGNAALLNDEIVIRAWADDDAGVLAAAKEIDLQRAPAAVLSVIAKAARNQRNFPEALNWYDAALAADPGYMDARLGLAMTLADSNRHADARNALRGTPVEQQNTVPVLMTSGYLFQREAFFLPAMNEYDRILKADPDNAAALRGKINALNGLLLADQSLEIARKNPGLLNEEDVSRLEVDSLGMQLRRAIQQPEQRYPYTDINAVLAKIDDQLKEVPQESSLALRLHHDRIVGRVDAYRTLEAITDYERLLAEGHEPPAFVHYAAARAYSHRQRPEEALDALLIAEKQEPNDLEIQIEKFYALVDLERHKDALALADELEAGLDPVNQEPGSRVIKSNEVLTRARIIGAMGRAYADQLEEAQARLEELVAEAPNNQDARYSLGNLYRYRGWEDRPLPEYGQVLTMSPDLLPARTSVAHSQFDHQEFPEARSTLLAVQPTSPSHRAVLDLNERWLLHDSWQLLVDVGWGESSGQTFGSDQHDVNVWLYTEPVWDNYRFYARTFDAYAEFTDGPDSRRRAAVGSEYRREDWTIRGELNWDRTGGGDVGIATRVDRRLNDQWAVGGTFELDSYATAIRADREGISSDLAALDISHVRDDLYSAGAGIGFQKYDDGNKRLGAFANTRLRLINGYSYKLDGLANVGVSSNSKGGGVPYFAPDRDLELMAGVENIWRQYRRFDRSLTHRVTALGGTYNQKNYGSSGIWTLAYDLNWSINESVELAGGVQRNRRVYDGGPEYQTYFNARLNVRF